MATVHEGAGKRNTKQENPLLIAALARAEEGWAVHPLWGIITRGGVRQCECSAGRQCEKPGKHGRLTGWQDAATQDPKQIQFWWKLYPHANIGAHTGKKSGRNVLDTDPHNGGTIAREALEAEHGALPDTQQTITGGGGLHDHFLYDGPLKNSVSALGPGLDIRSDGGNLVLPGSLHISGGTYEYEVTHGPDDVPLAEMPAWLRAKLSEHLNGHHNPHTEEEPITDGQRNDTLFKLACSMRARGCSRATILSALRAENEARCKPPLHNREVEKIANSSSKYEPGTSNSNGASHTFQMGEDEDAEGSGLPEIQINTNIKGMVDAAEQALVDLPGPVLYQRAKMIVRIAPAGVSPKWLQRPPDAPIISHADTPSLREYSSQSAQWMKYEKRSKEWSPALPPTFIFETLASRVSWKFSQLEGIICAPTLRPDGVLISTPGFDKETGLYLDLNGVQFPPVPEAPTQADAKAALELLQAPFDDFPFTEDYHLSAAIAGALTILFRFTVSGSVPAFGVRAHAKGTGKGLLVNTIAMIGTGRTAPTWTQTLDMAEEAKRLLSIARAGDACMHIDNITETFGSAKLESALTSPTVKDRLLGVNTNQEAPWLTVVFASGNNMTFRGDMVRRVVPIDLDPQVEHPEERSGFRHVPLLEWVKNERPRLVVAALTMMKAFFHAGCPKQSNVSEFGSFEQWSDLIRHSLIWAGLPDPCEGRKTLEEESDTSYEALATLLRCWADCYPHNEARSLKVITQDIELRKVSDPSAVSPANDWNALHDALSAYDSKYDGKRLDTTRIGNALRIIEGRVLDGQRLIRKGEDKHAKGRLWKRETIA